MSTRVAPHRARKRFGQNFLSDQRIIERLVSAINPREGDALIEIGPGLGALTRPLLQAAGALHAVEIDRDLAERFRSGPWTGLELINADALEIDLCALADDRQVERWRVAGNLPYNISTPLLLHLVGQQRCIVDAHLMLQREVVDRLAAEPGHKDYGRPSVLIQRVFTVEPLFVVPPSAFQPQPRVHSAVVRLTTRNDAPDTDALKRLSEATRLAFAQRRKTLRNNFRGVLDEAALQVLEIDPAARAETLQLSDFERLADALKPSHGANIPS